jgi:chromosome segregation ATPase
MWSRLCILALMITSPPIAGAQAQSETDRLREALRSAISQTRALEDQRAALQAKLTQSERVQADLKAQIDAAKAEVKQVGKEYREAVEDFNKRLAERDETLEKWRAAYEDAANVARAKDGERAKFESQAAAFKGNLKNCESKNAQLASVGRELLARYEAANFADLAIASEPLTGLRRTEIQNLLQDYTDKILDQKATP